MKGYVIADVGEVRKIDPPINTRWTQDVYQFNSRCFTFSGYVGYWGYGSKAALLLVNQQKLIKIALLEVESPFASIEADVLGITLVECPDNSSILPYSDDPEETLRLLKQQQDELRRKIDELRKQQR